MSANEHERWLTDPNSGTRLPRTEQPGYYPGFSTLAQKGFWDAATRTKILDRVHKIPSRMFFSEEEAALMEIIVAPDAAG